MLQTSVGTLAHVLAYINAAVDKWNADLARAVDLGDVPPQKADILRVPPGIATAEMAREQSWPANLARAIDGLNIGADGAEMGVIAKKITDPTETITGIRRGVARAEGATAGMMFLATSIAHLLAVHEHQPASPTLANADEIPSYAI